MKHLICCLLFLILLQEGQLSISFEPDTIEQTILFPNYDVIERRILLTNNSTISKWNYQGNCTGINADFSNAEQVLLTFNATAFSPEWNASCTIEVLNESEELATLQIGVSAYFDYDCSHRQNATDFCSNLKSNHAFCNNTTGDCDCEQNWRRWYCSVFCNANETCSGHGQCDEYGRCVCDKNFYGTNCSVTCPKNCEFHGYCNMAGTCTCNRNYYGPSCEKYCDLNTCGYYEQCSSTGTCECKVGRYGDHCQYKMCPPHSTWEQDCRHGKCNNFTGLCDCDTNYYGRWCDTYCDKNSCGQHGRCGTEGQCVCDQYYHWTDCQQYCGPDTCAHGDCDYYGHCQCNQTKCLFGKCDGDTCKCQQGHYGLRCDQQCHSCQNGLCDKMNGTCVCDRNYHAPDCSVFCNSNTTCSGNGKCDVIGKCTCYDGYKGDDCSSKGLPGWAWFFMAVAGFAVILLALLFFTQKLRCSKRSADYELLNENVE